ncbi:ATP-binding protein [Pseudomonas sp. PDM09]|uniref:ATP-binding protein n=1 Tax=Pseudomonas sp. PDM09 TaxID=2769270 RepID=UPI001780109F|nr:ATP-binding protein [Pseudomonas sp. PDM09]MBD9565281.1 ATP-binding protein [Pseudomonas sp. PDM09]
MTIDDQFPECSDEPSSAGQPQGQAAPASPELTGGAGFTFEDGVVAVYAVALLGETTAAGLPGRIVKKISVQQGALGHPLDDLIVDAEGADDVHMRLSLQVKRKLIISGAKTNPDFRETIQRAHLTVASAGFRKGLDRVGAIVNEITDANKRVFETLCEWARADAETASFVNKVMTEGIAGDKKKQFLVVRGLLGELVEKEMLDSATHCLLSHFVLMRFEMLHEGSTTEANAVVSLAGSLNPAEHFRVDDLWRRLLALVRISEGVAASFDRKTLIARLNGAFRLRAAPSFRIATSRIAEESSLAASEIINTIAGVSIPRERFVQQSHVALERGAFVLIGGLPGAGKSVVLRALVEDALLAGPALFLKADRISGASWAQYAVASGIGNHALEDLLVELSAVGTATLFIDGIDRVEVGGRRVLLDIFNTILASPLLSSWKVVATVRDTGMEPVRTWLPRALFDRGVQVLDVDEFNDDEAHLLASAQPALRSLLFGSEQVKAIVRRPFFAGILIMRNSADDSSPRSEVELATRWWANGGYGAEAARAGQRRNALVQLARAGASKLGRSIPSLDLDPQALAELEADGIVRPVRAGQTVRFVHDIYFEWAFLQYLISKEGDWVTVIQEVGEPPVLGRVVELLSQSELRDGEAWGTYLHQLEATEGIRSQWLRAWMLGPFGLPTFATHQAAYSRVLLADEAQRVTKLAVWFQAEKTKPNPMAFSMELFPDLDMADRLLAADLMAFPSDFSSWRCFCQWLMGVVGNLPASIRPDLTSVFEVWQNALLHVPNVVSAAIISQVDVWLADVEIYNHSRQRRAEDSPWECLKRDEARELESRLRKMLLQASKTYPEFAREYLSRWEAEDDEVPAAVSNAVFSFAPRLSVICPDQLAAFTLRVLLEPLPDEVVRRSEESGEYWRAGHTANNWRTLCIADHRSFFPSAPTREPFHSMFSMAPASALALVGQLINHATQAWRQLQCLPHEECRTPIPVSLSFPWGDQVFWGTEREYALVKGGTGSYVLGTGLMALEAWAFTQLKAGKAVDDVLRDVLKGHQSVAVLAIAVAIVLETQHFSESSFPLLANQRLWYWDIKSKVSGGANLIGFRGTDREHSKAVQAMNARPCLKQELRSIASMHVLGESELSLRLSGAIKAFPADLSFDYEEERSNPAVVESLKRRAVLWAEIGKIENYTAHRSEDGSAIVVQHVNPKAKGTEIESLSRQRSEMMGRFELLLWVDKFLESRQNGAISVEQAIERAKQLDSETLFAAVADFTSTEFQQQGAIAGVAAVVLIQGQANAADLDWAIDVCSRVLQMPMSMLGLPRSSKLLHHPVLYTVHALGALLHDPSFQADAQVCLIQLMAHPFEEIGLEALGAMLRADEACPGGAWLALSLAISLSMVRPSHGGSSEDQARYHAEISSAVDDALQQMESKVPAALPEMPPAWLQLDVPKVRRVNTFSLLNTKPRTVTVEWEYPPIEPDSEWLSKVLELVPISTFMADTVTRDLLLTWCDSLVLWTGERLCPNWSRGAGSQDFKAKSYDYFEWRNGLYLFLARISMSLDPEVSYRRFIAPMVAKDDETFCTLLQCFVDYLVNKIRSEPTVPTMALPLLEKIVSRILECADWKSAVWSDGRLHCSELEQMIRALFFVDIKKSQNASRFTNGDWSDVALILALTDPLLAHHGRIPLVASSFVTRCERNFDTYPIEHFVTHLGHVLGRTDGMPPGWRGTTLPARLAGLIQRFSERTQPIPVSVAQVLLSGLDTLVDLGDRRAAAVQISEVFKDVRSG